MTPRVLPSTTSAPDGRSGSVASWAVTGPATRAPTIASDAIATRPRALPDEGRMFIPLLLRASARMFRDPEHEHVRPMSGRCQDRAAPARACNAERGRSSCRQAEAPSGTSESPTGTSAAPSGSVRPEHDDRVRAELEAEPPVDRVDRGARPTERVRVRAGHGRGRLVEDPVADLAERAGRRRWSAARA